MKKQHRVLRRGRTALAAALAIPVLIGLVLPVTAEEANESPAVTAGKAFKLSGTTQFQAAFWTDAVDSFSIRRARFTLGGELLKNLRYRTTVDLAKTAILLDVFVEFEPLSGLGFKAGQFHVPFSLESLTSISDLDTINRSQVVNKLSPGRDIGGQGRDVGAVLFGRYSLVEYTAGVFNGSGINKPDANDQKDLAGRILARPFNGLAIGLSFYRGDQRASGAETSVARNREGLDLAFKRGSGSLKAEYIHARDGETSRSGWYLQGGWFVLKDKLQAVVKVESLDDDRGLAGDRKDIYTAGVTWFIAGRIKLQANFENHRPETGSGATASSAILVQFQAAF